MGERYREYANQILINSTDKKTGKLDLKLLDEETASLARKLAKDDGSYSYNPSAVIASYKVHVIHAINEVMGIVPKSQWSHDSDDRSTLENALDAITGYKDKEAAITHGLTAHIEDKKLIDGYKTLAEQHITADKPPVVEVPKVSNNKQTSTARAVK